MTLKSQRLKQYQKLKKPKKFHDAECDLVFCIIEQARRDGDIEFLENGAPLWLRMLGINLRPSMIVKLGELE
jgi:hypothetical protein